MGCNRRGVVPNDVRGGVGALSLILVAPFWGLWLLWPTYRFIRAWWRWQYEGAWAEWNGTYYEFDGRQIRILMQGDSIWFSADDVFDALGLLGRQRNIARAREIAGERIGDRLVPPSGVLEIGTGVARRLPMPAAHSSVRLDKQVSRRIASARNAGSGG